MANLINCFISEPFTVQEVEGDSVSNNQLENQVYDSATLIEGQYKFLITPEPFYVVNTTDFTINNIDGLQAGTNNTVLWSEAITGGANGSFTSTDITGITLSNTGTGGELLNTVLVTVSLKPTFIMPSANKTILLNIAGTAPVYVPPIVEEDPIQFNPENIFVSFTMMNNDPLVKIAPPRTNKSAAGSNTAYYWPNYPPLLGQVPGETEQVETTGSLGQLLVNNVPISLEEIWPNCGAEINDCASNESTNFAVIGARTSTSAVIYGNGAFGVMSDAWQFGGWTEAYTNGDIGVNDATPELIYNNVIPPRCGGSYQFAIGSENYSLIGSTIGQACGVSISSGMNWHVHSCTSLNPYGNYDPSAGGIAAINQFINVYSSVTSYRDANNNLVHIPWTSSSNLSAVDLSNVVLTQLDCWTVNVFIPWNDNFVFPAVGGLPIHECSNSSVMVKNLFTCFVGEAPEENWNDSSTFNQGDGCGYPTGTMTNDTYPAGAYNFNSQGNPNISNTLPSGATPAPGITHPSC